MDDETPEITPPDRYEWLWDWFWELSSSRRHGPNGPDPITYGDIEMWARLTGNVVLREEIAILKRMDEAFLAALGAEHREQRERED